MDNASNLSDSYSSTVDGLDQTPSEGLPSDADEYVKNLADMSDLSDSQNVDRPCEDFDAFLDGVTWKESDQAQPPPYHSVSIKMVTQEPPIEPLEAVTPPILPTSATFPKLTSPLSTILDENSILTFDSKNVGYNFTFNYSYPQPDAPNVCMPDPCINLPNIANSNIRLVVVNNTEHSADFSLMLDSNMFNCNDLAVSAPVTVQLNVPQYRTSAPTSFPLHQNLSASQIQPCSTLNHSDTAHTSSQIDMGSYQSSQAHSNNYSDSIAAAPPYQQIYNARFDLPSYARPENYQPNAQSMSVLSNQYSPSSQILSLDYPVPHHFSPREHDDSCSKNSSGEESRPRRLCRAPAKKNCREKPVVPKDKPWIRTNKQTKGGTSRTLKINNYNPGEVYKQFSRHPIGAWSTPSGRHQFTYNKHHELEDLELSTSRLKQFIQHHPATAHCKLTLYIQRTPADSKRRYENDQIERCRFADCPARLYGKSVASRGLITPGHYRVALDEFSYKYGAHKGGRADPFRVAGFVHLYCLERFLDVPALCRLDNISVEADSRHSIREEPNHRFAAALQGQELEIAASFIDACRAGNLRSPGSEWSNYPQHIKDGKEIAWKDHYDTLNYRMQNSKNMNRARSGQKQGKLTNIAVHCGNLDVVHKTMKGIYKGVEDVPGWRYTDSYGIPTGKRNPAPNGEALDLFWFAKLSRPTKKRLIEEVDPAEDEDDDKSTTVTKMARTGAYQWPTTEETNDL
jgi:hypothetical protein